MGYFLVGYASRVVIYDRKMFKRLATGVHIEHWALSLATGVHIEHWALSLAWIYHDVGIMD